MANHTDTEKPSEQLIDNEFKEIKIDPSSINRQNVTATTPAVKRVSTPKKKPFILGGRFFLLNWFYLWAFGLIHRCREQKNIKKILLQLANVLTAKKNGEDLDVKWSQEKASAAAASRQPKLIRALYELYGAKYIFIGLWKLIWAACTWAGAYYFLRVSIEFLEKKDEMQARTGHLYAMGLLLTSFGSSIAIHQLYGECTALGVQVKSSISVLIYRKALVLARIRGGAGEIINIMSTDVARIVEAVTNFHFLWSALVETILILALAFPTVGWAAALTAVILVLVVLPVQIYLGRLTSNIQIEQTAITTERVHLMSEILTAIKLIKFYAWETPFQEQINQVRAKELALFKRNLQVKAINMAVVFALPVIVAVSSLAVYNKRRTGLIDSSVVFTALSIFNTLRYPFLMLPIAVKSTSGARLALRRLDDFLTQPEVEPLKEYSVSEGGDTAIELIDGEFTWDGEDNGPALQGINLKVKRGEVIAIVGDVGSGKSSFVAALLGQIRQTGSGPKLKLYGKSSYVPQEAWLNNLTLRENIVFGKDFEEERYNTTVKVCALERDLTLLPHGDQTEIAERGSNLSGGQKQRVSLARAVYHKSDVILMDDPLSAVDQNVGKHIFDQCIRGYLSGRTVVIVTHQLQYLHRCDRIVMLQSGKIAYQGTYQELMANEPTFNTLINTHVSSEEEDDDGLGNDTGAPNYDDEEEPEPTLEEQLIANENNNQVTASGSAALAKIMRKRLGAGPRRHTLPPGTKVGDAPGTATIVNQNYATITPQERLRLLQRQLPFINKNSILASTLEDHVNINFINRAGGGGGYYSPSSNDFSRAIYRNELTIHSIPEGGIYGNRTAKERKRKLKQQHRKSVSGISLHRATTRASEKDSFDYKDDEGNKFHHHHQTALPEGAVEVQEDSDSDDSDDDEVNPAALVGEDKSMDELGFADYVKYFRAGSGVLVTLLLIALFFVAHGIRIGSDYWLRLWVPNTLNTTDQIYLGVYGAFIAAFAVAVLLRGLWFAHEATLKSKELHDRAFKSVMRAPMSFFETTSLGRILSAFSKCMFTVDDTLPDAALLFLQYFPLALGAFLLIACVVHWQNAVTVIVLLLIALVVIWYGSPADSKLKQLEALSKPPVFQHITTTLEGLFSIRAYGVQKRFDGMNMDVLDKNHQSLYAMLTTKTWTAFYLDIISSLMVYSTALFLVIHRHTIHQVPSVAGLALSNALQMLVFLQWTVRQMGEVQAQISVVGQLDYYGRMIEPEAPAENPATKPDASWPQEGRIDFDHLVLSYRKNTPPVLKDVSFTINPKEKVGIVGRTGSGKSTLLVGLLRIVEATSGAILIDGVDISKIGLKDLRTKVGIIPQEPVLFVGTIRTNLDPFGQYEDNAIWRALDAVHLGEKVKEMPLKLDSPVIEHGKNFSLGQRQLICIARSLVIGSKIIVLDEATASIDMVTDRLLQETIKESFADCTVLTIAHRLNTIIESDKVLVMDGGVVAEFGEPHKLLQDLNGIFAELVSHAGEAASKKLANIAEEAHKDRNNGLDLVMEEVENEKALEREEAEAASAAHSPVQVDLAVVDPAMAEPYSVESSVSAAAAPTLQVPASANGSPKAETEGLAKAKAHLRQLSSTSGMFDTGVVSIPTSPIPTASATGSTSPPFSSKGEAAVEKQFERLFRNPSAGDTPDVSPEMKPQTTTMPSTEPADDIHLSRSE